MKNKIQTMLFVIGCTLCEAGEREQSRPEQFTGIDWACWMLNRRATEAHQVTDEHIMFN